MSEAVVDSARQQLARIMGERRMRARIIERARALGWFVAPFLTDEDALATMGCDPGAPGLMLVRPPRMLLPVVAFAGTTEAQRRWISALTQTHGAEVHVIGPAGWRLLEGLLA